MAPNAQEASSPGPSDIGHMVSELALCQAKVRDPDDRDGVVGLPREQRPVQEYVLRLKIKVDDISGVQVRQTTDNLQGQFCPQPQR